MDSKNTVVAQTVGENSEYKFKMSVLRNEPNAFTRWLSREHPYIPEGIVCFIEGPVNQQTLNPYTSQAIILFRTEGNTFRLTGVIFYGSDNIVGLDALAVFADLNLGTVVQEMSLEPLDAPRPIEDTSLESIKAHIDGTHFSFETLGKIIGLAPYVPEFCQYILARERRRDLSYYLPRYAHLLILPDKLATTADYQRYFRRYGGNHAPVLWFLVPMEEINCDEYELHIGGFYHVPGREMGAWIWKYFLTGCARRKNKVFSAKKQEIIAYMESKKNTTTGPSSRFVPTPKVVGSFEDRLAPCLKSGLYGNHFPKDQERMMIARALKQSGVPIEFLEARLNAQNDRFPHRDGHTALKQRWDYEAHYKKAYTSPFCEKMECPLAGATLQDKKDACHSMFHSMFPNKKPLPMNRFKGPADWLNW